VAMKLRQQERNIFQIIFLVVTAASGGKCFTIPEGLNVTIHDSLDQAVQETLTIDCQSPYTDVVRDVLTVIQSPNYPRPYGPNLQCEVTITLGTDLQDYKVAAKFTDFKLEKTTKTDYLDIFDGETDNDPLLTKLYGSYGETIRVDSTRTNSLKLRFVTNAQNADKGFSMIVQQKEVRPCTVPPALDTKFRAKHVCPGDPKAEDAAKKSCERNAKAKTDKEKTDRNHVFFLENIALSYYTDSLIRNDNCEALFPEAWYCEDVPIQVVDTPAAIDACAKQTEKNCRSCRERYLSAETFEAEVSTITGHLYFGDGYYLDPNGVRHEFNLENC